MNGRMSETRGGESLRRHSPIKESVKAKSTSSSVGAEWMEGSTKEAGWMEGDMWERRRRRRRSGGMAEGRGRRHGLINVKQRDREVG